jgi:hypothetical protein
MKYLLFALTFIIVSGTAWTQDTAAKTLSPLQKRMLFFSSDEPVEITIVSDFKRIKTKKQKKVFQAATATVKLPQQAPVTEDIQIAARGEFRRETCIMPSISLDFKNEKAKSLGYLKRLKLVCGCSASRFDEELLLKEFLVYKIYNMLTEMSFNVRLVKMTYKDVQGKVKEYSQYGFLIEDVDDVAKRNGCREYNKPVLSGMATVRNQMTLVSLFQYMIGNTDWSLPNKHNVRFIQLLSDTLSQPYIVPYDFDYCGLVNAPYAIPQPEFGIERVTDRYYRGFANAKEDIQPLFQLFKEKKEFITAKIMGFELLDKKVRQGMVDFIDDFYKDLNDSRKIKYVFEQAVDHH